MFIMQIHTLLIYFGETVVVEVVGCLTCICGFMKSWYGGLDDENFLTHRLVKKLSRQVANRKK